MNKMACRAIVWLIVTAPAVPLAGDLPAVIDWAKKVEMGTLVSGVVSEVYVRPGQQVKAGDKLLVLDQRGFATQVSRRSAEHRHAKALLSEAQREDERAVELYDRTVLSDFERNQALIALKAAQAKAEQARAALVDARLALERSVLHAPFDSTVLSVNIAPGQTVVSELQSTPLVTLADTRNFRARAQVDADQAGRLRPGMALKASLRGRSVPGKVGYVGFEPVAQAGQGIRYELFVDLVADTDHPLRVGETVILQLD